MEVFRGELAHFAGANDHDGMAAQGAEDGAGELDRGVAYRDCHLADAGFRAHALGDAEGAGEDVFEKAADRTFRSRERVRGLDLAEDLGLADDHGVETGSDAEEMTNGVAVFQAVQVWIGGAWIPLQREEPTDHARGIFMIRDGGGDL